MRRFLLLAFFLTVAACRSGGGHFIGGVERSLNAFSAAFQTVTAGLAVAFKLGTVAGDVVTYKHTLLCDPEGSSSIDERLSEGPIDGTFLVQADLDECNGVGGEMSALGSFARAPEGLKLQWAFDGVVRSGSCDVTLSDLSVVSSSEEVPAASVVTGELTATCTGSSPALIRCTWHQTPALASEELLAACSCTGSGC
ncbi:MAG TPA: hypothetical protein VLJ37_03490 [bacterium]|nr:hypothetical protein [bacterium]